MIGCLRARVRPAATLLAAGLCGAAAVAACSEEQAQQRPSGMAVAQYASNFPIEDRFACHEDLKHNTRICAVFDGHGGWQCAEFAQKFLVPKLAEYLPKADDRNNKVENQIERAFNEIETRFTDAIRSAFQHGFGLVARVGACALVCVQREGKLYVANCGDCRAVLGTRAANADGFPTAEYHAVAMSRDHNARVPSIQALLKQQHPGENDIVMCKRPSVCYVKGRLQPTRSFGDSYLKYKEFNGPPYEDGDRSRGRHVPEPYTPPYITHVPEIISRDLSTQDDFVIAATDGLWDFLENKEAVDIVATCVHEGKPHEASQRLVEAALSKAAVESHMTVEELRALPVGRARRVVHDDTTVVVMYLRSSPARWASV